MATDKKSMTDEGWEDFERYLFSLMDKGELHFPKGAVFPEPLPIKESRTSRRSEFLHRLTRAFLQPALAYALVLVLIYPAYLGVIRKSAEITKVVKERDPVVGISTTRTFSLGVSGQRRDAKQQDIVIGPHDEFVTLSFFVAVNPEHRYDLQIVDGFGAVIAEQKNSTAQDELGNFSLVCNQSLFHGGSYVLKVLQVNKTSSTIEQEDTFRFRVTNLRR